MTKQELLVLVLKDPYHATIGNLLTCDGGFGSGRGVLRYEPENEKWRFVPNSATGRSFEPTDKFVEETILNNAYKLFPTYKDIYDTKIAAATLGRKGGKAKSEAKTKAARENGKKGGRPRKSVGENEKPYDGE